MLLRLVIFLLSSIAIDTHYSLYQSEISLDPSSIFDCLYAHLIDGGKEIGLRYIRNSYLIPYCRREKKNNPNAIPNFSTIAKSIFFAELKKQGVTSEQLLQWYAPIDLAERYEMNGGNSSEMFHKCRTPWFGSMCQYRFDDNVSMPFGEIVQTFFPLSSSDNRNEFGGTCYPFIENCRSQSWPLCLDWREICDGKFDCIRGEDEQWCEQLQLTQCAQDQYRCHYGGQCIPLTFVRDNRLSIDCLDGSDEQDVFSVYNHVVNPGCFYVPTFRCQERIGRYSRSFQCGEGEYRRDFSLPNQQLECHNRRDIEYSREILTSLEYISNKQCRETFLCALHSNRTGETGQKNFFSNERCSIRE